MAFTWSVQATAIEMNGQIANCVFQVTSSPPRIAVSLNKENLTHEFIQKSGEFSVSVLEESVPMKFIGLFGDSQRLFF